MNQADLKELKARAKAMSQEEQVIFATCLPDCVIVAEVQSRFSKLRDLQKALEAIKVE